MNNNGYIISDGSKILSAKYIYILFSVSDIIYFYFLYYNDNNVFIMDVSFIGLNYINLFIKPEPYWD